MFESAEAAAGIIVGAEASEARRSDSTSRSRKFDCPQDGKVPCRPFPLSDAAPFPLRSLNRPASAPRGDSRGRKLRDVGRKRSVFTATGWLHCPTTPCPTSPRPIRLCPAVPRTRRARPPSPDALRVSAMASGEGELAVFEEEGKSWHAVGLTFPYLQEAPPLALRYFGTRTGLAQECRWRARCCCSA